MRRLTWPLVVVLLFVPMAALAQSEEVTASALSAAPASIGDDATVMAWDMSVVREGTNGWTCFPDNPETEGNDPMCLDAEWLKFADAWINEKEPSYDKIGFGYMLQGAAAGESNVDPYAEGPTADNEWMAEPGPPHIMMVVPNGEWLKGLPTTPDGGGPWVMWKDHPLVHVMIPTTQKPPH